MGRITIIGTGWTAGQLTLDAVEALRHAGRIILHTDHSGCAEWLKGEGIAYASLDELYETCEDFDEHARAAADAVRKAAREGDVAYGVFDIRDRSAEKLVESGGAEVRVIPGPPAEGPLLALAMGETRCVEASDWEDIHLTARENCLVRELDGRELAGEVKLRLMEVYPEESEAWVLNAGCAPEKAPLYALDRGERFDHRTCVLVPAQRDIMKLERYDTEHLVEIIRFLCSPGGCPWDRVQTHETLRPYILEEAYEVIDAIDEGSPEHLYDELGDMLLQIVLHAEIGRKHGEFDMSDVATSICQKMISRHTHVFGRDHADDAGEVLGLWSKNKMAERGQKTRTEVLKSVTRTLPATLRAAKVLKRSAEAGLKAGDGAECAATAREKLERFLSEGDEARLGELLMAVCDLARVKGIDPELALNGASDRFIERFSRVEDELLSQGLNFETISAEKLSNYWEMVKL